MSLNDPGNSPNSSFGHFERFRCDFTRFQTKPDAPWSLISDMSETSNEFDLTLCNFLHFSFKIFTNTRDIYVVCV